MTILDRLGYPGFTPLLGWMLRLLFTIGCTCFEFAVGETTKAPAPSSNSKDDDDDSDMLKGMAAGFGGFIGIIVLICVLWCCCCNSDESCKCCQKKKPDKPGQPKTRAAADKGKVGPSPPHSANSWTRTR